MINNLCACCLRDLKDYPEHQVYCDPCRELRQVIASADAFSLVRAIETTRQDVAVVNMRSRKDDQIEHH